MEPNGTELNGALSDDRDRGARDAYGSAASAPLADSLAEAARRAGFAQAVSGERVTGGAVLGAIGGVRGILEAVLPGFVFLLLFTLTPSLPLALGVSVGVAAVFSIIRIIQKGPFTQAIGGLVAVAASAALALVTGRAENNFILGLITNVAYGVALLISVLVRWPLIGLAVGFLLGEGTAWRADRRKFRAMQGLTLVWVAMFAARLAVQVPLYLAGNLELLATFKLVMGLPLYAPLLVLSWLIVRAVFPGARPLGGSPAGTARSTDASSAPSTATSSAKPSDTPS
ncbi:DUF3159 domain-containing protein [Naasia lichenicola]|uniref:DUF3159 domain-containing protein n=2 Tax=Naasia lichenicola TaxID=2565933 RepID=A0A4S4FUQ9_9MICO|nr:DUF3159 domain-containing protein [Naasia lichenicola]